MDRFDKADGVAMQWLQHRDGERFRLEAEVLRLQAAVRNQQVAGKLGVMNVSVETELQLQLQALSKALQSGQV